LYVKIDRKRKIPVTTLLRALGMTEADHEGSFQARRPPASQLPRSYARKDPTGPERRPDRGLPPSAPGRPGYRRQRPSLLENMFYNFKRFDFSRVGRYKINKRLNLDVPNTPKTALCALEDLEAIIAEIIRLNNTQEPADDIDSLANRRVKLVGELVQRQFRIGLLRMERNTKDRMSMSEIETVSPAS
jgi:DNA-directed RNA polymerase subunit beta